MFNQVEIYGLVLNVIIYILMVLPIILFSFKKSIYTSNKKFLSSLSFSIILEIIFSIILYNFSKNIFSIFTSTTGIINYAVYASKILFISSSLYGFKILVPAYISQKSIKKTVILILSKITVHIFFIILGYSIFNIKGILYSIPICDILYYIIYFKIFLNIFR